MRRRLDVGPGWVAVMCALYYVNPVGCFWPFCAAMACHELGHALAMTALGAPPRRLRLNIGGAVLEGGGLDYRRELLCALAGPGANLLLTALGRWFPRFGALCLCLAVFNLLPFPPLDGGRALEAALMLRLDARRARRMTAAAAVLCGLGLAGGALWLSLGLGGGLWPILAAALALLRVGLSLRES